MRQILFITSFIFITAFYVKGQELSVEQTLSYINKQLNNKENKVSSSLYNCCGNDNYDLKLMDDYYYKIEIRDGLLIITRVYHNTKYDEKEFNIIEELSIPIKDIDADYDFNSDYQKFLCLSNRKTQKIYIPTKMKDNNLIKKVTKMIFPQREGKMKTQFIKELYVDFSNDNLVCDKIKNAFSHLINLSSRDSNYYTLKIVQDEDPFANPIKRDSIIQNNISTINSSSIPMKNIGGVYEIPVLINGVLKLNFIFDAGASDVSISPDVALTLIRTGTVTDKDFLGTETYKFADGSTAKSKVFLIKEIQLGNKKVSNVKASISNSVKAPLLLGQSVLNKFGKVTIDYNIGVIIFED